VNTKTTATAIILGLAAVTSVAHSEILTPWDALGPQYVEANGTTRAAQDAPTRAEVRADLEAWRASGLAKAYASQQTPDVFSADYRSKLAVYEQLIGLNGSQASHPSLTRAQVNADLAAWRASGLAEAYAGKKVPDVFSADYREKVAHYQQLSRQYQRSAEQG